MRLLLALLMLMASAPCACFADPGFSPRETPPFGTVFQCQAIPAPLVRVRRAYNPITFRQIRATVLAGGLAGASLLLAQSPADLIRALGDRGTDVRDDAREKLEALGPAATPALSAALSSPDPQMVKNALRILSFSRDPRMVAPLIAFIHAQEEADHPILLDDAGWPATELALIALTHFPDPAASAEIDRYMMDPRHENLDLFVLVPLDWRPSAPLIEKYLRSPNSKQRAGAIELFIYDSYINGNPRLSDQEQDALITLLAQTALQLLADQSIDENELRGLMQLTSDQPELDPLFLQFAGAHPDLAALALRPRGDPLSLEPAAYTDEDRAALRRLAPALVQAFIDGRMNNASDFPLGLELGKLDGIERRYPEFGAALQKLALGLATLDDDNSNDERDAVVSFIQNSDASDFATLSGAVMSDVAIELIKRDAYDAADALSLETKLLSLEKRPDHLAWLQETLDRQLNAVDDDTPETFLSHLNNAALEKALARAAEQHQHAMNPLFERFFRLDLAPGFLMDLREVLTDPADSLVLQINRLAILKAAGSGERRSIVDVYLRDDARELAGHLREFSRSGKLDGVSALLDAASARTLYTLLAYEEFDSETSLARDLLRRLREKMTAEKIGWDEMWALHGDTWFWTFINAVARSKSSHDPSTSRLLEELLGITHRRSAIPRALLRPHSLLLLAA